MPPPAPTAPNGRGRPAGLWALVPIATMMLSACATTAVSTPAPDAPAETTSAATTTSTTTPSTTPSTTPTSTSPTASTSTSTTTSTTTTLPDPLAGVHDRECVAITSEAAYDDVAEAAGVDVRALWIENGFPDAVGVDELVDVCVDNGVNDVTGGPTVRHDDPSVATATAQRVTRQQRRLNELFEPYATQPLVVDGISGPITGQHLCAARVALDLEPTVNDMSPGSREEAALFAATGLPTPTSTVTDAARWSLIDRTCQMMFVGAGPELVFVFPTSTGSEGFETRLQERARVFRYNPALDNGGWHDSTEFPVGVDNPLNGNLYKPLYFDLGQAIHGATNVPPVPASKGCARISVAHQELLIGWLGLLDVTGETWIKSQIDLTVNVQGEFVGR